jgi:hypothetical protein
MAKGCACCQHPRCGELDAALLVKSGTLKDLAAVYGVSAFSLSRHKANHLLASPSPDTPLTTEEEIRVWLSRAEELWNLAGANGDLRGLATALQQGLRSLEFSIKRQQETEKAEVRSLPTDMSEWSEAERARMREYIDCIVATTQLSDVVKIGETHERTLLPLRERLN